MNGDILDLQMRYSRTHAVKTVDFEENDSFRARVAHVLRGRSLKAFVAEIGLGPNQSLTMSAEEISAFVAQAEARLLDDPYEASAWRRINRIPDHPQAHFTLED